MLVKGFFAFCVQAVLLKAALSQCIGSPLLAGEVLLPSNMALEGLTPIGPIIGRVVAANIILDTSAPEPSGVSIISDDIVIEGTVLVTGNLPFLGTVGLEGVVPATGISGVSYECGTGNIGVSSDVPGRGVAGGINRISRF